MGRGVVKWFSAQKGYGFLRTDTGVDLFVHASKVQPAARPLEKGTAVIFDVDRHGPRGDCACNVRNAVENSKEEKAEGAPHA
jgi:CspA family cold shock protein